MINSNRYKLPVPAMPFGLCRVSAAIEEAGHKVRFLDLCFSEDCAGDITRAVEDFLPDMIGISIRNIDTCTTYEPYFFLEEVKNDVISPVKSVFKGTIIIGGSAVGINAPEILDFLDLKYAIRGDGELAMVEFIRRMENSIPLRDLGGLVWRRDEEIIVDNPPMRVQDLDSMPARAITRYLDFTHYRKLNSPIQIQTKRGCALQCSYCTYNTLEGHKWRLRDPQKVADEIEFLSKETGIRHFEFTDSTFNFPLNHSKSVLKAIIAKKMDLSLQTMGLNPGAVDEELADLLKEAHFDEVQVSVESGCDTTLKGLGKNFTKADVFNTAKILHKRELNILWYYLTGAPGETKSTLLETADTIKKTVNKEDMIIMGNGVRIYKGSPLSRLVTQDNPNFTKDNFLRPVSFAPKAMSLESIRQFNKTLYRDFPNLIFFEDVQRIPYPVQKVKTFITNLVAPGQPDWKAFIFINNMKKTIGINFLKRFLSGEKDKELVWEPQN